MRQTNETMENKRKEERKNNRKFHIEFVFFSVNSIFFEFGSFRVGGYL